MTLRQSHFVPPVPLLLAEEAGLPAEVELETRRTPGSAEQLRALLTGDLDIAVTAIDNLYEWTRAGADLRLVAQVERTTPLTLYARPGIERIEELEGRRFAVDALGNGFSLVARDLLGSAGVTAEYVEAGGVRERLDALRAGAADATLLGPPFDGLAARDGMPLLARVAEVHPRFPGQGLVVRAEIADSAELVAYLAALARAVEAGRTMSDEDGIALLGRHGMDAAASAAWNARPATLVVDPEGLALLAAIRDRLGLLPRDVDLAALHDPRPLARALTG